MLEFIQFSDHCVITRDNGGKDKWDNPINSELIYDGACLYEEGGSSYTRIFTNRNPTIYLPESVAVNINDAVTVTTESGREIKSVVKIVRDVKMTWRSNVRVTRIELKQAQGD